MKTLIQYNLIHDVIDEHREIVESAAREPLEALDIDDVNSFLNGIYLFHKEAEEDFWKSLS